MTYQTKGVNMPTIDIFTKEGLEKRNKIAKLVYNKEYRFLPEEEQKRIDKLIEFGRKFSISQVIEEL